MTKLRELYDMCDWMPKFTGEIPPEAERLYYWTEHEAEFAQHFFGKAGRTLLTNDHPSVNRSLHYGRNQQGEFVLVVREVERDDIDVKEVAEGLSICMDPDKVNCYIKQVIDSHGK